MVLLPSPSSGRVNVFLMMGCVRGAFAANRRTSLTIHHSLQPWLPEPASSARRPIEREQNDCCGGAVVRQPIRRQRDAGETAPLFRGRPVGSARTPDGTDAPGITSGRSCRAPDVADPGLGSDSASAVACDGTPPFPYQRFRFLACRSWWYRWSSACKRSLAALPSSFFL